ncbi:MAG: hypothetical protein WCQ16_01665 [Verrucomicrobiae bacterium]
MLLTKADIHKEHKERELGSYFIAGKKVSVIFYCIPASRRSGSGQADCAMPAGHRHNAGAALSAKAVFKPTKEFHTARH